MSISECGSGDKINQLILDPTKDIFTIDVDAIVNTVNCVGVMGAGIALAFKVQYPAYFKDYKFACNRGELAPGKLHVYRREGSPKFIISFPTKRHWRNGSKLEDIDIGLESLVKIITENDIRSIAIPKLGCGLGGLDWEIVKPKIVKALENVDNLEKTILLGS